MVQLTSRVVAECSEGARGCPWVCECQIIPVSLTNPGLMRETSMIKTDCVRETGMSSYHFVDVLEVALQVVFAPAPDFRSLAARDGTHQYVTPLMSKVAPELGTRAEDFVA
jgi:hypothetical protein